MIKRISSGNKELDCFLNGGYELGVISTIYGPAGSGKTNLIILALNEIVKQGKKIIYIDTESNFSTERFGQINPNYKEILDNIIFIKPSNFKEQHNTISELKINEISLIIIDSIGALYRLEGKEYILDTNKLLGMEVGKLSEIAMKHNIPVLMTNQVYSSFDDRDAIQLVGGDITKYGSRCLIELKKFKNERIAIIKKHRSIAENIKFRFKITSNGIEAIDSDERISKIQNTDIEKD